MWSTWPAWEAVELAEASWLDGLAGLFLQLRVWSSSVMELLCVSYVLSLQSAKISEERREIISAPGYTDDSDECQESCVCYFSTKHYFQENKLGYGYTR